MMKAILGSLSGIALIAFTYLCITAGMAVHTNSKHVSMLLMSAADTTQKLNKTIDTINAKNGTVAQLDGALQDIRLTVAHSDRILTKEGKSIDMWNAYGLDTLTSVNNAVSAATKNENEISEKTVTTLQATTESVKALQPLVISLNDEAKELKTATASVNTLVTDPNIKATAANLNVMSKNGDDATKDLKDYIHGILHPSWPKRLWGYTVDIAHAVL